MKLIGATLGVMVVCSLGLGAQSSKTKEETKIKVEGGKEVTVSGCLERNDASGGGYLLSTATGGVIYQLVTDDDLSKHVGHRIQVKGKASDRDGKVKIDTKVGTSGGEKSESKTEIKGNAPGWRYLGVKSVKMVSSSCM